MALKPKGLLVAAGLAVVAIAVSAGSLLAQQAQPQVAKPNAVIDIVAVPANIADPNAIVGVNGLGAKVAEGTTGLNNVSVQVPVTLQGSSDDPKVTVTKYAWTLTAPTASKSTLSATDQATVKFTPDVSGIYKIDLITSNGAGAGTTASVQIHAGEYIGAGTGNCFQCHPQITDQWSKTGHAVLFHDQINGGPNPRLAEYGTQNEGCIRCHTTGYYIGAQNGGYPDMVAQTDYKLPPNSDVQASKDNWANVPVQVQNMATIGCEDCHGPAKDHVTSGSPMAASLDDGVCNVCHNGGGHHVKGAEIQNSAHSDKTSIAWTTPIGPAEQACVRCHSGKGFITFLANPTNQAAWDNTFQNVTCAVCHDPHSNGNAHQLRIVGKPVQATNLTKDFGLSAVCVECHNARTLASSAATGGTPHYSAAGELLSDTGGVTYGQTIPNSPHGTVVGTVPVANPDPATNEATPLLFGGDVPGPCVVCHMTTQPSNPKDPNQYHVGEHSFNAVNPDNGTDYTAACQPCHAGVTDFNFSAKFDFDGNGKVEGVQQEVAGLLTTLQSAIATSGIKPVQGYPYFDQTNKANWTTQQKNAMYNYLFVRGVEGTDGKASAIHNFKRSVALLQLSYKDLTGKDVPNATPVQ
jgi:hypothetical protein